MANGMGYSPLPCVATPREVESWLSMVGPRHCLYSPLVKEEVRAAISATGIAATEVVADGSLQWLPREERRADASGGAKLLISTSGTTGTPKAMVIDTDTLWSSGHAFMQHHGMVGSRLRFWNYLPMPYLGGLYNLGLIPLCVGGSTVLDEPFSGRTFLTFWQTVQRSQVSALWLVPSIVRGLVTLAERTHRNDVASFGDDIKIAFLGTAPIRLETKRRFEELFNISLLENFALSETTFFTTETKATIPYRKEGSVGEVLPYVDIKFADVPCNDEVSTEVSRTSEILVRSPYLFSGFLSEQGETVRELDEDGYLATGDLGHLDETGNLIIDGRRRDIIKKGGYFISLREVELLAEKHEFVTEAAAVQVTHDFYGEGYELYLCSDSATSESARDQIQAWIRSQIVKFKWPERIVFCKAFPKTASGKTRKHLVAAASKVGN
jgi:acyl-CoA synthetase (AMP-forming)/AMP-acid ligase II